MNKADEEQEPEYINAGYIECLEHQRTPDANKQPDDITADAADARFIEGCQGTPNADKPLEDIADILLNRDMIHLAMMQESENIIVYPVSRY